MKVNWFSPLPPANTGIAVCSERVIEALSKRAELTVWTDQTQWDERLNHMAEIRSFDLPQPPWGEFNAADVSYYNLGNSWQFHKTIWEVSRRKSGIVILHDLCLQHLFAYLYLNDWHDPEAYCDVMEHYYGPAGRRAVVELIEQKLPIEQFAVTYPLTALALENAAGAVVHNQAGVSLVGTEQSLPVAYLPLPYSSAMPTPQVAQARRSTAGPPYQIITFGFIGENRRLRSFLKAWAELSEREAFRLRICGRLWDTQLIKSWLRELGLEHLTTVCGYLSEEALHTELERADLAVNLRYPSMGEASLSQLVIWEHALPALVTRVGWYATLPEDTAAFIRHEQ